MIVEGKKIAAEIKEELTRVISRMKRVPTLAIVIVGSDPVIESFVAIKKRFAGEIGAVVREYRFSKDIGEAILREKVESIAHEGTVDGVVIQLPLPNHMKSEEILNAIPPAKDVDMLSARSVAAFSQGHSSIMPPVAGAIDEILRRGSVQVDGKEVIVLGHGKLVGKPAAILMRHRGAHVTVVDREMRDLAEHIRESSIVISGVGKPGFITPEMLCQGVVLIDAGTSEAGGKIVGDAHPDCRGVAGLFTPVPGGVGPITVAMLFKNLCICAGRVTARE